MAPNGPLYASTVVAVSEGIGDYPWTNPGNAAGAPDGSYASIVWNTQIGGSYWLESTGYTFNVPDNAVIDGIAVSFYRYGTNSQTNTVQIMKSGSLAGTQKSGIASPWSSTPAWETYGGSSDLWGTTWTPADINSSGLGAAILQKPYAGLTTGAAYVDSFSITVYWHVNTANVPTNFIYQVFDSGGNYIGNLPNVISPFALSQEINTSGSQITVDVGVSADTAYLPVDNLTDESGNILTDESSNTLTTENQIPMVASGSSGDVALIKNGNLIQIYKYGYYNPNGKCVFLGKMERWEAAFGGSGEDKISITCYSDGADFDNHLVRSSALVDQSQTDNSSFTSASSANMGSAAVYQTITPGAGVTQVSAIVLDIFPVPSYPITVTVRLYASGASLAANLAAFQANQTPDATASVVPQAGVAATYQFNLGYALPHNAPYLVAVDCNDGNGTRIKGSLNTYAGGSAGNAGGLSNLYFQTYYTSSATNASFSSTDPSTMLTDIIATYNTEKGLVTTTSSSVDQTGLSLGWKFNTNTITEGVRACLSLAPDGFYYYVDLGTDILYFKQAHTTPDLVFTKGRHLEAISVVATIENIKNDAFVTGALVSGSNIFVERYDTTSVNKYGRHIDRLSDPHIPDTTTAAQVATAYYQEYKDEQYQTIFTVMDKQVDITQLRPGLVVGFSGFGTFVDGLLAEIVRIDMTADESQLTLGILPKRLIPQFEKLTRGLVAEQTIDNPSTPS